MVIGFVRNSNQSVICLVANYMHKSLLINNYKIPIFITSGLMKYNKDSGALILCILL